MSNEEIIKIGSAVTSIAVAANTLYSIASQNAQQKKLEQSDSPPSIEAFDYLTQQFGKL